MAIIRAPRADWEATAQTFAARNLPEHLAFVRDVLAQPGDLLSGDVPFRLTRKTVLSWPADIDERREWTAEDEARDLRAQAGDV